MNEYEFTLKFSLPGLVADPEQYVEALAAAGCDDALFGIGQNGRIALDFTRAAGSAFEAIASALQDVRKAIPDATLIEASPDLVGLTDIAALVEFTRQNMRKLMVSNISTFPAAVHEGNPSIWNLASILTWLYKHQKRPVDATLMEVAEATMSVNIAKETRKLPGTVLPKPFEALFAN